MDLQSAENFPHQLEEGEMVCDKCGGTGCIPSKVNPDELASICSKCQGDGYVDWVSNITGKAPKYYGSCSSSSSSGMFASTSGPGIPQNIISKMANNIAKNIDKEILEGLTRGKEQKVKYVGEGIF